MRHLKVFGMQRTGTTFAMETMNLNLLATTAHNNEFGHKHSKPLTAEEMLLWAIFEADKMHRKDWEEIKERKLSPIIIIKNPYSWFRSIESWGKVAWAPGYSTEKAYSDWNKKYAWWKDLLENPRTPFGKGVILKYEDLIRDVGSEMMRIASILQLEGVWDPITTPKQVDQSAPFTEERRMYYLDSSQHFGLFPQERKKITKLVDWDLMKYYGYEASYSNS